MPGSIALPNPVRALWLAGAAVLLAASAGCRDGTGSAPTPTRVDLAADSLVIPKDSTATLAAKVLDESGRTVERVALQWRSSDPAVASVDARGAVRALRVGSVYVAASYTRRDGQTLADSARVVVRPGATFVAIEDVNPNGLVDVSAGTRTDLVARVTGDGQPLAGVPVSLVLVRGSATLSRTSGTTGPDGRLAFGVTFGPAPDTVVVEARTPWAGQPGAFRARVYPPVRSQLEPDSLVLTVGCARTLLLRIKQPNGTDVVGASADFTVGDSTVVSLRTLPISGTYRGVTREVTGTKVGTTRIIASYRPPPVPGYGGPVVDTALVRVEAPAVASVRFLRSVLTDSVGVGGAAIATAEVADQCGAPLADQAVSFRSLDPSVIELSPPSARAVRYTGLRPGTGRIVAQVGSFADTVQVRVRNVRVEPANPTVSVGASLDLRVVTEDASGNPVTVAGATFSERSEAGYTLTRDGRFTARQPGTVEVFATGAGVPVGTRVTIAP